MNMNDFARYICKKEGKKISTNIAQVKEILKIINDFFCGAIAMLLRGMKKR